MNNSIKNKTITASDLIEACIDCFYHCEYGWNRNIEFTIEKDHKINGCFSELGVNSGCSGYLDDVVASADIIADEESWESFYANIESYQERFKKAANELSEGIIIGKCEVQSNSGFDFVSEEYIHEEGVVVYGPNYDFYLNIDITPKIHEKGEAYFERADCGVRYRKTNDGNIEAMVLVQPFCLKNLVDNDEMSYNREGLADTRYEDSLVDTMVDFGLDKAIIKGISKVTKSPQKNIDLSFHDGHTFSFDEDFEQM